MRGLLLALLVALTACVAIAHFTHGRATIWSKLSVTMPTPRSDFSVSRVGNKLYLIGGCVRDQPSTTNCEEVTDTVDTFTPDVSDPKKGVFTAAAPMPRSRHRHSAVVVDSKIYVMGGRDLQDNLVPQIDVYDATTNSWSTIGNVPANISDHAGFAIDGIIYLVGGYDATYNSLDDTYAFEVSSQTWLSKTLPKLTVHRGDLIAEVVGGKGYAFGGFSDANFCNPVDVMEEYDPVKNTWTLKTSMGVRRGDKAVATLDGLVFVIGGEQKNTPSAGECVASVPVRDVESYDPIADTWVNQNDIVEPKFRFDAETINDHIYIFGGQLVLSDTAHSVSNTVEVLTIEDEPHSNAAVASLVAPVLMFLAAFTLSNF